MQPFSKGIAGARSVTQENSVDQSWYVENAGIVLLHPFFPALFKEFGLISEKVFVNQETQQIAIDLLHYLTTGNREAPEYKLVVEKHLCGWPKEEPLIRGDKLPSGAESECQQLLLAVINHWGKLGSTSPEGLQNGFLQRPGKLSKDPVDGWRLQIEQSGIDVLLNYLPWGFSTVNLPWMENLLMVEWPY